ncbi:MAG TPA: SRPBCC domain-containing protein [Cyclobacteriaceae bacterium]|jgi:hypothetical protein|nr:SRPBCC domain-containing protein [Cyclobacteriaceae bacterium]
MKNQDFTTTLLVDQSPAEVFNAINNPRAWWSEDIDGCTDKLHEKWSYRFEDNHRCQMKTIEMIPGRKVVWLVEDNYFKFIKDQREWTGNKITFEISQQGNQTQLVFTQVGLVPTYECYQVCRDAWTGFIHQSLQNLITNGTGQLKWYLQPSLQ